MAAWYTIAPSPWSIAMYALWAWWGSRRLPRNAYLRFHRIAAWVDALWIAGIVILVGDILWVMAVWIRWGFAYPSEITLLIYSLIRNTAGLILCLLMSKNWWSSGKISWNKDVYWLWLIDLLYLAIWFGFAPSLEWTHWVFALENGYGIWPFVWLISFVVGRIITTTIYMRTWNVKPDR